MNLYDYLGEGVGSGPSPFSVTSVALHISTQILVHLFVYQLYVFPQYFGWFLVITTEVTECHVIFGQKLMFEKITKNRDLKHNAH